MPRLPRQKLPLPPNPYPQPDPERWKPLGLSPLSQPQEPTVSLRPIKPSKQARNQRKQQQRQPQGQPQPTPQHQPLLAHQRFGH